MTACLWFVMHVYNNEILRNLFEVRPFKFQWQNDENSEFVSISRIQIKKILVKSTYVSFNILVLKYRVK